MSRFRLRRTPLRLTTGAFILSAGIDKWTGDEQTSFEAVLAPFKQANPDVTIKYTGAGDNVPQIVSTAVQGGNPPDIATLPQPGLMRDFASRGALKPINFSRAVIARNYAPVWLQLGSVNGQLYGLFFKGANKSTVWYNVPAFRAAGVTVRTSSPCASPSFSTQPRFRRFWGF